MRGVLRTCCGERAPMNEIERVRALLGRVYPTATATIDGPTKWGYWLLEVNLGEIVILVLWRGAGFTLAVEPAANSEPTLYENCATVEQTIGRAVARVEVAARAHRAGSSE